MEKTFDVVAVGTLNVDLIVIGEAPRELEALNHWVSASQVALTAAGSVGYCAIDLARLGLRVSLLSSVAALTLKGMGGTQTAPSLTQVQTLNTLILGTAPGIGPPIPGAVPSIDTGGCP